MKKATAQQVKEELGKRASKARARSSERFFKTAPGEYGEGDEFIGVTVPEQRSIAKKYFDLPHVDIIQLLDSSVHEHRLTGLLILILQYENGDAKIRRTCYRLYLDNIDRVNNWDLVDSSAHKIAGRYLYDTGRSAAILDRFARSRNLWRRRIAMIATAYFISQDDFEVPLRIARKLLYDKHDLIHKAVGWMLREIGKRNRRVEEKFLKEHYRVMPRTMLRYAIERFPENLRKEYLNGKIA